MDLSITLHRNRPVCFYLVVQRDIFICISGALAVQVFLATACPGDVLVPTLQVA